VAAGSSARTADLAIGAPGERAGAVGRRIRAGPGGAGFKALATTSSGFAFTLAAATGN